MSYILKQYDSDLLFFDMDRSIDGVIVHILRVDESRRFLLPLDLEVSDQGLAKWLKHRTIPSNRAYVQNFLAKLGLNEKDTKGIIDFCKGLSLNDSYWVVEEGYKGTFEENNLYDNRFSNVLSSIAFTGYGSYQKSSFRSSPEFTTNGMLPKCWRRKKGKILLFKGGTEGFANSGNEPYCEYYAYQIAQAMGLKAVPYGLAKWKGRLCSTCELFTSKDYSFLPIGNLAGNGITGVIEYCKSLGDNYYDAFVDMIVFDAIVLNTDRHFGNFGFLVDSHLNKICDVAPLFDHGLSLLTYAMDDDLENVEAYVKTRTPATYSDFMTLAKELIGHSQKEKLRRLINFKFKKHPRYNWPAKRLKVMESLLQARIKELLD